jgi:hypothetical protein
MSGANLFLPRQISPPISSVSASGFAYFFFINQLLFRCEHRKRGHQAHLYLRNLQEIDTVYLEALFCNDWEVISRYEMQAQAAGFGPMAPCSFICSRREQKMLCREYYHNLHCNFANSKSKLISIEQNGSWLGEQSNKLRVALLDFNSTIRMTRLIAHMWLWSV